MNRIILRILIVVSLVSVLLVASGGPAAAEGAVADGCCVTCVCPKSIADLFGVDGAAAQTLVDVLDVRSLLSAAVISQ